VIVDDEAIALRRPDRAEERIALLSGSTRLRVVLDAELAGGFAAGGAAVVRLDPATGPLTVTVSGQGVGRLTVHAMPVSR